MLIPGSSDSLAMVVALAALLLGLWINFGLVDRKWRFELFAFDLSFGAVLATLVLALTLGNSGASDTFTFDDALTVAGKRNIVVAVGAGVLFGIGNLFLLAGSVVGGMSTAVPVAASVSLLANLLVALVQGRGENLGLAAGLAVASLLISAFAQKKASRVNRVSKAMHPAWKGYLLAAIGGLFFGGAFPAAESARAGDIGVGGYGAALFVAIGAMLITPVMNVYLLNLPVQGPALSFLAYLKGTLRQHLLGVAAGLVLGGGLVAYFAATAAIYGGAPPMLRVLAGTLGLALVATLCGLLVWREHAAAPKARLLNLAASVVLGSAISVIFLAI